MALALKSHRPIFSRSPFFINCIPFSGTIVSAVLSVTIQSGDRRSIITSMTDVKSYTLTKTDAVDGIIVFDIAPLIKDFYDNQYIEYGSSALEDISDGGIYFVKVTKLITNNGGAESPTTAYYTCLDGYASFKDGVNYLPSTPAVEYGFDEIVIGGTNVTLMATDCYRQIGVNSYAVLGLNLGEWQRLNSSAASFARIKFGSGETWKTSLAATTNVKDYNIAAVDGSPPDYTTVEASIKNVPLGKVNMFADWDEGFDYLRVGHFVKSDDIGGTSPVETTEVKAVNTDAFQDLGSDTFTILATALPDTAQTTIDVDLDPCGGSPKATFTFTVFSIVGNLITGSFGSATANAQMACLIAAFGASNIGYTFDAIVASDDIASINGQPTLRYEIICEPKYNVVDCLFINKFGCWDSFSFLKKSANKLNVTSSNYNRSVGFVDRGALGAEPPVYSYSLTDHQNVQYNKNGLQSITCNTGFVAESFNLLLEELMLSEKVYLIIDDVVEPVVLNTRTIDYKTSVNDKLINYTLDFEFAYNKIQSAI